jgi:hypothetical protein
LSDGKQRVDSYTQNISVNVREKTWGESFEAFAHEFDAAKSLAVGLFGLAAVVAPTHGNDDADFVIGELFPGKIVVAPGSASTQRIGSVFTYWHEEMPAEQRVGNALLVRGIVTYDDGFGNRRFTRFCHLYNTKAVIGNGQPFTMSGKVAELHEFGNDAN